MRHKGLNFRQKKKKKINLNTVKVLLGYLFWAAVASFIALVLMNAFGFRTNVIGNSMEPELYSGQQILIDRMSYVVIEPKQGNVIAFLPNGNEKSHYYVKRIVAVPGDTIRISDGRILVNGAPIETDVSYDKVEEAGIASVEIKLSDEEYFVLGDNINSSEDSRSGNIGKVKKEYILGKVWFRLSKDIQYMGLVR